MNKEITRVVSAEAGWSVGTPIVDDEGLPESVYYVPVIAWVVYYDSETESTWSHPVTPELLRVSMDRWILRTPAGQLIEPETAHYFGEADLINNWRLDAQCAKDREAEKKASGK